MPSDLIATIAKSHKIFIDTCSLYHDSADKVVFETLAPKLTAYENPIIVPFGVVKEIEKHVASGDGDVKAKAQRGLAILKRCLDNDFVEVRGENSDQFVDHTFHSVFAHHRLHHHLTLITQDVNLAKEIKALSNSKSVKSRFNIYTLKITPNGKLIHWRFGEQKKRTNSSTAALGKKFKVCSVPITLEPKCLPISDLPGKGDQVISRHHGIFQLTHEIGAGGEGRIFQTNADFVCKIYARGKITDLQKTKINLMLEKKVNIKGVCWPVDLVSNKDGQFVGYIMARAEGVELRRSVFNKPLLKLKFPDWKRNDLITLCISILKAVQALHRMNIIIGDINASNILACDPNTVFFVDTDSFQVENYPCPVGTVDFTPPSLQGKNYGEFLRTKQDEMFAVTTLLFMLLMPGKAPFSHQGGGNPGENIRNREFSYPLRNQRNGKAPEGPWRFIWSNFPYKTKEAFYNSFAKGELLNIDQWINVLKSYLNFLEKRPECNVLFPTTFKQVTDYDKEKFGAESRFVDIRCRQCNELFSAHKQKLKSRNGDLCPNCNKIAQLKRTDGKMIACEMCHQTFLFSVSEQEFYQAKGIKVPRYCKPCREKRRNDGESIICSECRNQFLFSLNEQAKFHSKGYQKPKVCKHCRDKKKRLKSGNAPRPAQSGGIISGIIKWLWR